MDYQVLYCGKHGPTWQRGVVTKKERFVKVETLEGTNMFRLFDHVTVGIQLRGQALSLKSYTDNIFTGNDTHANTLSYSLLDNKPWKGNDSSAGSGQINFLQEAKLDKAQSLSNTEESIEEPEEQVEEQKPVKRRKKQKVNVYEFFEEMRQMGLRPPHSHKDADMDVT